MPGFTPRSQPEKWFTPFRKLPTAQIQPDEHLRLVMIFKIKDLKGADFCHAMFYVVEKGDKAIARNAISHIDDDGFCDGHADDVAEYEIKDVNALINEVKSTTIGFITRILSDKDKKATIDMSKPVFAMEIPSNKTVAEIAQKIANENDPMITEQAEVLGVVLGLTPDSASIPSPFMPEIEEKEAEKPVKKPISNIKSAADELALIKKFGKKKMEDLAKEINYKGSIINKQK